MRTQKENSVLIDLRDGLDPHSFTVPVSFNWLVLIRNHLRYQVKLSLIVIGEIWIGWYRIVIFVEARRV